MAGQSFAMGEAFGKGFQFGKRKISSMTNEQFNKLTGPQAFAETTADITAMIPTMSSAMEKFHTLQTDIILKMIDYISKLPADVLPQLIQSPENWVPQEYKINYPDEFAKFLELIKKLIPSIPEVEGSVAPPFQPPAPTGPNPASPPIYGPKIPPGGILPPQKGNTIIVGPDGQLINKDVRLPKGTPGTLRAPSQIIKQFNLLNAQIPAIGIRLAQLSQSEVMSGLKSKLVNDRVRLHKQMVTLWEKYALQGKVNYSNYKPGWNIGILLR